MKIRPPSACNPARFARHCLARVARDSSVRLLARERCGIRARCVRVLDARGNSRARAFVVVRSFASVVAHACARAFPTARTTLVVGARANLVVDEVDAEDATGTRRVAKASVRVATTRRGGRRAGNGRRRRRRGDSRFDAFVVATTRGCIDANVFIHAFIHAFDSNASVGACVALFEF